MRFINYLIKESIITANLNVISNNAPDPFDNTYGDLPGALGSNFMPIVPNKPDESDEIMDRVLKQLINTNTYSKDIQNFLDPNDYAGLTNNWKKQLETNKISMPDNLTGNFKRLKGLKKDIMKNAKSVDLMPNQAINA